MVSEESALVCSSSGTSSQKVLLPLYNRIDADTHAAQQLLIASFPHQLRLGQFKLSSGGTSDYYIDCRTTTLHAEGGRLTGEAILDLLERRKSMQKP